MVEDHFSKFKNSLKFHILAPIIFAVFISIILTQLIIFVSSFQNGNIYTLQDSFNFSTILNLFLVSIISLIFLIGIFRFRNIKKLTVAKILVFLFIEGGMLSILLFGKLLFTYLRFETPIFLIFFAAVAYICTYFAFLSFFDSLSLKARNRLFIISSGSLGSFLGILIPIIPIIIILSLLSIFDFLLIKSNFFQKKFGIFTHESIIFEMAFSTNDWGIGIGDLICYSMLVSSASANFGIMIGGISLFFLLLGSLFTMKFVSKEKNMPGLPLSFFFGLLPSLIILIL